MKKIIKNCKGSHIGTVISFVLFITFVAFLYSITSPALKSDKPEENLLIYLENKIIENISVDLNSMSVSFSPGSEDCLQVNNYPLASNVVVKDVGGNIINSEVSGDLYVDLNSENFFKIFSSESFLESSPWDSSTECSSTLTNYEIGISRTEEKVSEEKVSELLQIYSLNYEEAKRYFKVPDSREFGFGFIYNNGTLAEKEAENISASIFINRIPVEYFDKEANVLQGFVNIKVW